MCRSLVEGNVKLRHVYLPVATISLKQEQEIRINENRSQLWGLNPMRLRDISFQEDYRSGNDNILEDFYKPALRASKEYWRAVGYFSSSALEAFGSPLGEFVKNGGRIKLITSVELDEEDVKAIESGADKQSIYENRLEKIIETQFADGVGDGVSRLITLLELNRLEIKIAVPKQGTGIYHEKVGIFFDDEDYVAFTGSSNESHNAFYENRECIDVYPSWEAPSRALRKRRHFEEVWNNTDVGVEVYTFPEAAKNKLLRVKHKGNGTGACVQPINKWRHQEEALKLFLAKERGVLNMATGTGKTRTSLNIVKHLVECDLIDTVIVTTDGNDLLDQWYFQLLSLRREIRDSKLFRIYRDYSSYKDIQEFLFNTSNAILLVSRAAGVKRDPLVTALRSISTVQGQRTILIHDEVHRLGSPRNRQRLTGLSDHIRFRLGLSATPEREYDEEGNQFIQHHIGPEIMRFELSDAIQRGILVPFNYYPLRYELTDEDRKRLHDVFKKKAAREAVGNPMSDEEVWIELARVYKTSRAKIPVFNDFIKENQHLLRRCIVFVETEEYGLEVLEVIHQYRADFHTYLSGEDSDILKRFARGDLECLITCHRISEGIDIRSVNTVILFSSARAKLETIQRIGRCLRFDPTNPDKIANVVDFIRVTEEDGDPNNDEERCDWLTNLSKIRPVGGHNS